MKLLIVTLLFTLTSVQAFAGACDTNAASLQRNLQNRCGTLTGAARTECAQHEFDVIVKRASLCRTQLEDVLNHF